MSGTSMLMRCRSCLSRLPRLRDSSARLLHHAAPTLAARQTVPTVGPVAGAVPPPLPIWAGGDVETLVHRSIDDMHPVDAITLPGQLFNAPVREDLVHRVVHWQLAKRRAGTASTKTRAEVKGSGKKIRPQKGTGMSRQGAITSPLFRGGGRAHGPKPRDWSYPLPHGVRRNALRSVLSSKFWNGQLWIVESGELASMKTGEVVKRVGRAGWQSLMVLDDAADAEDAMSGVTRSLWLGTRNVQPILAMNVRGTNVYDLLRFDMTVLTLPALNNLCTRFEKYASLV